MVAGSSRLHAASSTFFMKASSLFQSSWQKSWSLTGLVEQLGYTGNQKTSKAIVQVTGTWIQSPALSHPSYQENRIICLVAKSCLTPCALWTVACQAPLSMGFFRQEYWSGLPFPSPRDLPDPEIRMPTHFLNRILWLKPLSHLLAVDMGSILSRLFHCPRLGHNT